MSACEFENFFKAKESVVKIIGETHNDQPGTRSLLRKRRFERSSALPCADNKEASAIEIREWKADFIPKLGKR